MREVAVWVEEAQCKPICWDDPDLFLPGDNTFLKLQEVAKTVDGAILIFSEDDKVWYRGDTGFQPRDNVLVEYGMFAGILGQHKAAICVSGTIRTAADLAGIIVADLDPARRQYARRKLLAWLNRIETGRADPVSIQMAVVRRQLDEKEEEINFLRTANSDLLSRIAENQTSRTPDDDRWESLFTFNYVFDVQRIIVKYILGPTEWHALLGKPGIPAVKDYLDDPQSDNPVRLPFIIRKALRVFRNYRTAADFASFVAMLPPGAQEEIAGLKTWRRSG
jgi:hypothetical protein